MKHTLDFNSSNTDVRSATMKLEEDFEDMRTCDLTFKADNFKTTLYMMEPDARQLAEWILENTKP